MSFNRKLKLPFYTWTTTTTRQRGCLLLKKWNEKRKKKSKSMWIMYRSTVKIAGVEQF